MSERPDWTSIRAPSLDELAALAQAAFALLPADLRALTGSVVFSVAEFPDDEVVKTMALASPFDLLGLFEGVGLAQAEPDAVTGALPNRIWLYRQPILDYWIEHDETLGAVVAHVLIHEIGHHFGLSDADMAALEANAG